MKKLLIAFLLLFFLAQSPGNAQTLPNDLLLDSRPGAAYTLYLNFTGFSFNGQWGNTGLTPGFTGAYTTDGDVSSFSAQEISNIRNIYSRVAEKYSPFNINVTTIDPAIAAGQAGTDAQRQTYYDSTARLMHTVIGGNGSWFGNAGGVSFLGTTPNSFGNGLGFKTNFVFSDQAPSNLQFVAEATAHENGHGLNLNHQARLNPQGGLETEYDTGTGTGPGSKAPIMGDSYSAQRGLWRVGSAFNGTNIFTQNDAGILVGNSGMNGFIDDGIGHSLATATTLALNGSAIDFTLAKGVIVPASSTDPNPNGASNYLSDFFKFSTAGGSTTIRLNSGRSTITPGVADPGAMLDGTLFLLDSGGNVIASSSNGVFVETITMNLNAGDYFIQISSAGSPGTPGYFDMGSYFLTGTIVPVPEPASILIIAGVGGLIYRRWRIIRIVKQV